MKNNNNNNHTFAILHQFSTIKKLRLDFFFSDSGENIRINLTRFQVHY